MGGTACIQTGPNSVSCTCPAGSSYSAARGACLVPAGPAGSTLISRLPGQVPCPTGVTECSNMCGLYWDPTGGNSAWPCNTLTSPNGAFKFVTRVDGDMVVYDSSRTVVWSSNTYGDYPCSLVLTASGGWEQWCTDTLDTWNNFRGRANSTNRGTTYPEHAGTSPITVPYKLELRDDGRLLLRNAQRRWTWSSQREGVANCSNMTGPCTSCGAGRISVLYQLAAEMNRTDRVGCLSSFAQPFALVDADTPVGAGAARLVGPTQPAAVAGDGLAVAPADGTKRALFRLEVVPPSAFGSAYPAATRQLPYRLRDAGTGLCVSHDTSLGVLKYLACLAYGNAAAPRQYWFVYAVPDAPKGVRINVMPYGSPISTDSKTGICRTQSGGLAFVKGPAVASLASPCGFTARGGDALNNTVLYGAA
ncbi:hypothetical protein HYH03_004432 [Edaphochlamys debaryana]|uniref:Bulb-type lectin domain-containing protein n=1 Tax=Edaphochlamys debaryana TaxID=47281 RepID=A0A836C2C4_9CHLO|nr:hypothetical protein HYH03_004432 [Edaphochlamys debaryana]|eukprot:KAG2497695.1 hypothetical protein HYH03_004432 [Edaphochlamys debaryana]